MLRSLGWPIAVVLLAGCGGSRDGATAPGADASADAAPRDASSADSATSSTDATTTADSSPPPSDASLPAPDAADASPPDAGPPAPPAAFWHLESPPDSERTWLVAPSGERVFVLGVNTVMRGGGDGEPTRCEGIGGFIRRTDPSSAAHLEWARLSDGASGGRTVPRPYGFNSVGAFSQSNDFDDSGGDSWMIRPVEEGGAGAPYTVVVYPIPSGTAGALRDERGAPLENGVSGRRVGDPFHPAFLADLDLMVERDIAPRRADPQLQMWFLGNENGMFDVASHGEGVRDLRRWLWTEPPPGSSIDAPSCAPHALSAFLRERYDGDIAALDTAWEASYPDFAAIVEVGPRPVPYEHDCNLACREDLQRFVHDRLVPEWVRAVTTRVRAADPNHLVASPRLALASSAHFRFFAGRSDPAPDVWVDSGNLVGTSTASVRYSPFDALARSGDAGFDLVAVNVYTGAETFERPWFTDGIHKLQDESGLPVFVSELGVRARIDGWSNRGGAGSFVPAGDTVDDQLQRGDRYRTQLEQLVGFRRIVGAAWHAWSDRYVAADPTLQINMGLVQCDDPARGFEAGARWSGLDDRVAETNAGILALIAARTGL